jgi:hypothetical protein
VQLKTVLFALAVLSWGLHGFFLNYTAQFRVVPWNVLKRAYWSATRPIICSLLFLKTDFILIWKLPFLTENVKKKRSITKPKIHKYYAKTNILS